MIRQKISAPAPRIGAAGPFSLDHVRHDAELTPLDTLRPPVDPITRDRFTIEEDGLTRVAAAVPFAGGMSSRLAPSGHFWSLLIDTYRLTEFDDQGDTLRTITRAFEPIRVSGEEREQALEGLEWFTNQGGRIDPSKIPTTRSLAQGFVFDEMDHIWVATTPEGREAGWVYDIFTPEGRYLGPIELPFQLRQSPPPVFRDGTMYAVTTDALDVQQLVVATIRR